MLRIVLLLLACLATARAQPYDFTELEVFLQITMLQAAPGGFSLTLAQNGRVIYRRSFGTFQIEQPVSIASASKWYSAAAILALAGDGVLSLDDTAGKYFPDLAPPAADATIRQMLSHTSGLTGGESCIGTREETLAGCVNRILAAPLLFAPGAYFHYGGASLNVAGRIAEIAAGKTWDTIFLEKIALPVGMTCTSFGGGAAVSYPSLSGDAVSCAGDYSRFLLMLLQRGVFEGRRVLPFDLVEQMQASHTNGAAALHTPYAIFPELAALDYGLGHWRERVDVETGLPLEAGSQGVLGFSPWIDLERNLTGVLVMEGDWRPVTPRYVRMKEIIRRIVPKAPVRHAGVTHAATLRSTPLSPGLLLTIYGDRIGPDAPAAAQSVPLPPALGGARVLFDGEPGGLLYAGPNQVSVVAPAWLEGRTSARIEIERGGARTDAITLPVEPSAPGLFRGAIWNQEGLAVTAANPARPGEIVAFYGTGGADRAPARVYIGGVEAEVLYSGPAPGAIEGLFQVNARVPFGVPPSGEVPLMIETGGARSPAIPLAIR